MEVKNLMELTNNRLSQTKIKYEISDVIIAVLALISIFCMFWYGIVGLISPSFSYKGFVAVVAVMTTLAFLKMIAERKTIPRITIWTLFILIIIGFIYYVNLYRFNNGDAYDLSRSYFLCFIAQSSPSILMATLLAYDERKCIFLKENIRHMSYVFAIISLIAILFQNNQVGGGGFTTDFGLNYQNVSYMAAYSSNYLVYDITANGRNRKIIQNYFNYIVIAIDLIIILVSGGRGGFISFVVINGLQLFFVLKNRFSLKTMLKWIIMILALGIASQLIISHMKGQIGIDRIFSFFKGQKDMSSKGRIELYKLALSSFKEKPVLGQGFGSVFFALGFHSHNILFDVLVEGGIVGFSAIVIILVGTIRRGLTMFRDDYTEMLWFIIFLNGSIMSFLSGYYLANVPLLFGIFIIMIKYKDRKVTCSEKNNFHIRNARSI